MGYTKDRNGRTFAIGTVCFDRDAKEHVKVSNGTCIYDHSTREAWTATHGPNGMGACVFAPSEAIALRIVGSRPRKGRKAVPLVAYTHRSVRPEALTVVDDEFPIPSMLQGFVGRI